MIITESGTFVLTATGMTAVVTGSVLYRRVENFVSLFLPAVFIGTSNATTFTLTGLPTNLIPSINQGHEPAMVINNAVRQQGAMSLDNAGLITVYSTISDLSAATWTAANQKGLSNKQYSYHL